MRAIVVALLLGTSVAAAARVPTPVTKLTDPKSVASVANPGAKPVPLGDLSAVRAAWAAVWSPDGKSVVVSTNLTGRFNLWRVDLGGNFPVQLARSDDPQAPEAVTPDGVVLFAQDSGGDEVHDLYAVPLAGGAVSNLTNTPDFTESGARLSPDGRLVALWRRAKTGTAQDLVVLDRQTGTARQLTQEKEPGRIWYAVGWSPDGATLYATRGSATETESAIYRVDVAAGAATPLTPERKGLFVEANGVSPDGRSLSLTSNEGGRRRAGLMDATGGKIRWLAPTPWEQKAGAFSPDGRTMVYQTTTDARVSLGLVDVASLAERPLAFPAGTTDVGDPAKPWRADGKLLVIHQNSGTPGDLWIADPAGGAPERVTRLAIASLDPATLPRTEVVAYRSEDGTPISALLTVPYNAKRDGTNPAILLPHGGPTGQSTDIFSRLVTALVSRGYFVLQPNFRGSTGYGQAFQDANVKDLGGRDLEDVVAGAQFLMRTGYVDPKRVGITGGSYGGFMTLMALGKYPDVFAAGVNQFGIINWFTMWENAVGGLRDYQRALVGDPVKDKALYEKQSPMTYAKSIRAPLLNLQGENDARVPKGQTDEVVKLVKANGGTVEAVYYPAEGHGFTKLENNEDARRRTVEWFDRHLKGTGRGR